MKKILYSALIILSVVGFSCTRSDMDETFSGDGNIALKFTNDGGWAAISSDTDTRSKPGMTDESVIKDVWIFQFDGVADTSPLASPPKYTENITDPFPFVYKASEVQRVVVVANTGDANYPWSLTAGESSYASLLSRVRTIAGESDMYNAQGNLLLFGQTQFPTNGSVTSATVPMKHNAVKLDFNVTVTNPQITIEEIQVCNIPSQQWLVPEGITAPFPAPRSMDKINFDAVTTSVGGGGQFVWYLPTNMQGTTSNNNAKSKNTTAPKDATYIKVKAVNSANGDLMEYIFYPGANFTNDFNLETNKHYVLSVTIAGADDYEVDSRIVEYYDGRVVDMAGKTANCYILNPPKSGDPLKYRIYPTQVDLYWGKYENDAEMLLNHNEEWTVELLWQDLRDLFKSSARTTTSVFLSKSAGVGIDDYFELEVPKDVREGNFTIRIYKTADVNKTTLWSWHMWVTDYDPDISGLAPADTQFVYGVDNGNVHRYQGSIWTTGLYKDRFIMDRNLGQLNSTINSGSSIYTYYAQGTLYYQFGRKDPFPCLSQTSRVFTEANVDANVRNNTKSVNGSSTTDYYQEPNKMRDVIQNPTRYFYSGLLTFRHGLDDENNTTFRVWRDRYTYMTPSEVYTNDQKSIYDPCPYGWKLPNLGTFEDFVANKTVLNDTRGLQWTVATTYGRGLRYWPYIKVGDSYPVGGDIRFPANSRIYYHSVSHEYTNGTYVNLWYSSYTNYNASTSKPDDNRGYFMQGYYSNPNSQSVSVESVTSSSSLTSGMNVRCVSHNHR